MATISIWMCRSAPAATACANETGSIQALPWQIGTGWSRDSFSGRERTTGAEKCDRVPLVTAAGIGRLIRKPLLEDKLLDGIHATLAESVPESSRRPEADRVQ
jgi:hypothetical protein